MQKDHEVKGQTEQGTNTREDHSMRFWQRLKDLTKRLFHSPSDVGSIEVGTSGEEIRVFVETIPCDRSYFKWDPVKKASRAPRSIDYSLGYETIGDAILGAEDVGRTLLLYVEPENLLFCFCQTFQSLVHAIDLFVPFPSDSEPAPNSGQQRGGQKRQGQDENEANPRAIVLCKVVYSENLKEVFSAEQQKGSGQTERYEITWPELQKLKKSLGQAFEHSTSAKG